MGMGSAVLQLDINPGASGTQSATSDELDVCRSTENSTTSSSMSPRKERVVGARRVWGTLSILYMYQWSYPENNQAILWH